jgi:hypothetical protein
MVIVTRQDPWSPLHGERRTACGCYEFPEVRHSDRLGCDAERLHSDGILQAAREPAFDHECDAANDNGAVRSEAAYSREMGRPVPG